MLHDTVRKAFAAGLRLGYAGDKKDDKNCETRHWGTWIFKGWFAILAQKLNGVGAVYGDSFHFGERSGGGHEMVELEVAGTLRRFMRVYFGATRNEKLLASLGISSKLILVFLKEVLQKFGNQTRLDREFRYDGNPRWRYRYRLLHDNEGTFELPFLIAEEVILFNTDDGWVIVFKHYFGLIEVK